MLRVILASISLLLFSTPMFWSATLLQLLSLKNLTVSRLCCPRFPDVSWSERTIRNVSKIWFVLFFLVVFIIDKFLKTLFSERYFDLIVKKKQSLFKMIVSLNYVQCHHLIRKVKFILIIHKYSFFLSLHSLS